MENFNIYGVITSVIALCTFIKALMEYIKQGKQKRAELLEKYRIKFLNEKVINKFIEEDDEELKKIERIDRYYYLGLFEEISVLLNSQIFKTDVVHYFFGYYAIKTSKSVNFWEDINQDSIYWKEFNKFSLLMEDYDKRFIKQKESKKLKI